MSIFKAPKRGRSQVLAGRKEIIFDAAVEMFALEGYENVSMRAIAEKSGIRVSSIYNHFSGKAEILEAIYRYYVERLFDNSATIESIRLSGQDRTLADLMRAANWSFTGLPPKQYRRMSLINRLIYGRFLHDPQARLVFREHLLKRNTQRRQEMFEYARAMGHLAPEAEIDDLAELLVFVRLMITIVDLSALIPGEEPFSQNYSKEHLGHLLLNLIEFFLKRGGAPIKGL